MAFWNETGLEPKRAFRWKVTLFGDDKISFLAKKVTKPQFTIEEAEHKFLNKSYYFPGHVKWDPVTVTLVDGKEGLLMSKVIAAINAGNYETINTGTIPEAAQGLPLDTMKTISKSKLSNATGNKGLILIEQLDVDGVVVEQWTLHNTWLKSVKPSELSYDTEDLSTYDLELRFDWAKVGGSLASNTGSE